MARTKRCMAFGAVIWNDWRMLKRANVDRNRQVPSSLALVLLATTAACFEPVSFPAEDESLLGVRANQGCPADESCSDATPKGLRAKSLSLEAPPFVTALGGAQTFELEHPDGERFDLEFTATANDESIEVVASSPGQFTIRGAQVGGAAITLRDASGAMFDRFPLYSKAIDQAFLAPFQTPNAFLPIGSNAVFAGSEIEISGVLFSPDYETGLFGDIGEPMADEGMELSIASGSKALFTVRQDSWNLGVLTTGQTLGTGTILLRASSGEEHSTELSIFDSIGRIELDGPQDIAVGTAFLVCSIPFAETVEVPVLGVPLTYQITGPAQINEETEGGRCVDVTIAEVGPVEVAVQGGGASASIALTATE